MQVTTDTGVDTHQQRGGPPGVCWTSSQQHTCCVRVLFPPPTPWWSWQCPSSCRPALSGRPCCRTIHLWKKREDQRHGEEYRAVEFTFNYISAAVFRIISEGDAGHQRSDTNTQTPFQPVTNKLVQSRRCLSVKYACEALNTVLNKSVQFNHH